VAPPTASAAALIIDVISNRADPISAGDALVPIECPTAWNPRPSRSLTTAAT
jgi:hypothetical protein